MPKRTMEQIKQIYDDKQSQLKAGKQYFDNLMCAGITVKDPKTNEEVTFNDGNDAMRFLAKTRAEDPDLPLDEIGRNINGSYHMYMFLYSKGVTPDEIKAVLENPGQNTVIENKIKELREDYFKLALSKNTDDISDMYAEAFKVLADYDVSFIKDADTFDKFTDIQFDLEVISGSHSAWVQTNHLGGQMKPVDVEIVSKVQAKLENTDVNLGSMIGGIQYVNVINARYHGFFAKTNLDNPTYAAELAVALKSTSLIDSNPTLQTVITDSNIIYEQSVMNNIGYNYDALEDSYASEEYYKGYIDTVFDPQDDSFMPQLLNEITIDENEINDRLGKKAAEWGKNTQKAANNPAAWKKEMEEQYKNTGYMMDGFSALHAVNLAKAGTYDSLVGKQGDGQNMLDVMHGQYEKFDQLTPVSKAAVITRFYIDHPDLFNGTVENMLKVADALNVDLDNPVYAECLNRRKNHCIKYTARKLDTLTEKLAENRLSKKINEASADEKKNLAKTLLIMQIGRTGDKNVINDNENTSMISYLASGNIDFKLPKMNKNELNTFKTSFPKGKAGIMNGIEREIAYKDNAFNIKLNGTKSSVNKTAEADLRGVDPEILNNILTAFDSKIATLDENAMNNLIGALNNPKMERTDLSNMIRGLGMGDNDAANEFEDAMVMASTAVNPPYNIDQDDFILIDRIYSYEPEGERKYPKFEDTIDETALIDRIAAQTIDKNKEVMQNSFIYYTNLKRQIEMYSDAAEKMHRILEENEKENEPSNNVRTFAVEKEKEFAAKYNELMKKMAPVNDILNYAIKEDKRKGEPETWRTKDLINPAFHKDLYANYTNEGITKEALEADMMDNFFGIEFETTANNTLDKLAKHTWKFMGIKFSNSDIYDDIVKSMTELKSMREKQLNNENVREYKEEYNHLRDLCAEYIVTHRRVPRSSDGKERLNLVKSVWEGMSNVNERAFDEALAEAGENTKIANVNIHKDNRQKVSYDELARESDERKERIKNYKEQKTQKVAQRQNQAQQDMGMQQ